MPEPAWLRATSDTLLPGRASSRSHSLTQIAPATGAPHGVVARARERSRARRRDSLQVDDYLRASAERAPTSRCMTHATGPIGSTVGAITRRYVHLRQRADQQHRVWHGDDQLRPRELHDERQRVWAVEHDGAPNDGAHRIPLHPLYVCAGDAVRRAGLGETLTLSADASSDPKTSRRVPRACPPCVAGLLS
jgi:hypothetical protein